MHSESRVIEYAYWRSQVQILPCVLLNLRQTRTNRLLWLFTRIMDAYESLLTCLGSFKIYLECNRCWKRKGLLWNGAHLGPREVTYAQHAIPDLCATTSLHFMKGEFQTISRMSDINLLTCSTETSETLGRMEFPEEIMCDLGSKFYMVSVCCSPAAEC